MKRDLENNQAARSAVKGLAKYIRISVSASQKKRTFGVESDNALDPRRHDPI